MKKFSVVLSLIAVAGLCQADLRSEVLAARRKQEKLAMAKDVKGTEAAMKEFITSDFKYMQSGKTEDAKSFIRDFTASLAVMDKVSSSSSKILALKESGNQGSGSIELSMTGIMKNPDKKTHAIDWTGVFAVSYRKVDGRWKMATMTAGAQKFLMDGKPVKM